jgi:hypothetical protein
MLPVLPVASALAAAPVLSWPGGELSELEKLRYLTARAQAKSPGKGSQNATWMLCESENLFK